MMYSSTSKYEMVSREASGGQERKSKSGTVDDEEFARPLRRRQRSSRSPCRLTSHSSKYLDRAAVPPRRRRRAPSSSEERAGANARVRRAISRHADAGLLTPGGGWATPNKSTEEHAVAPYLDGALNNSLGPRAVVASFRGHP